MSRDDIRKSILMNPEKVRDLLLNSNQVSFLKEIWFAPITANELAKWKSLSIQNASGKLKLLYKKGYLSRINQGDPTGGNMFVYEFNQNIFSKG